MEEGRLRTPVLADVAEVQSVLAGIAQRHFESQVVKEVDSLASFMCAVKGRGGFDLVSMKTNRLSSDLLFSITRHGNSSRGRRDLILN